MISTSYLLILLVIVLVIFGAGKLPEVGSALGKGIKNFKSAMDETPGSKEAKGVSRTRTKGKRRLQ